MEHLKALLAQAKLNIPTIALEKAIVMPRDTSVDIGYCKIKETLMQSFIKEKQTTKKTRKKGQKELGPENYLHDQLYDKALGFRVFEYGNYPLVDASAGRGSSGLNDKELRPKNGQWMLKLPREANWAPLDPDTEAQIKE